MIHPAFLENKFSEILQAHILNQISVAGLCDMLSMTEPLSHLNLCKESQFTPAQSRLLSIEVEQKKVQVYLCCRFFCLEIRAAPTSFLFSLTGSGRPDNILPCLAEPRSLVSFYGLQHQELLSSVAPFSLL